MADQPAAPRPPIDQSGQTVHGNQINVAGDLNTTWPIAPNTLNQAFTATAPNQKWVGDITYIATRQGWLYVAAVLDLFSRRMWAGRWGTASIAHSW